MHCVCRPDVGVCFHLSIYLSALTLSLPISLTMAMPTIPALTAPGASCTAPTHSLAMPIVMSTMPVLHTTGASSTALRVSIAAASWPGQSCCCTHACRCSRWWRGCGRREGWAYTLLWAHLTNEGSISVPTLVKYPLAVLPSYRLSSTV